MFLGAIRYHVKVFGEDDKVIFDKTIGYNKMKLEDLLPGRRYHFQVASIDIFKRQSKEWSPSFSFITSKPIIKIISFSKQLY